MPVPQISAGISRRLNDHDWPGNVRELGHFAERVVLGLETEPADAPALQSALPASGTLPERMDEIEARIIRETLEQSNGDVAETIATLGIARKTFYDKLQRHGINRADYVKSGAA
ncbi:C4-dicarboxylate transport transcriptional regulatory protein DctD [compost metagenome]